jgi:hypothetical protein
MYHITAHLIHRVLVRADHFSYPTAAGKQRRAAPPTARPGDPVAFARGWNVLPGGTAGGQVLPLRAARLKKQRSACQRVQAHKKRRRCE